MEHTISGQSEIKTIPKSIFLYAYSILPVLLVVIAVDFFYLKSWLLPHMGIEAILLPLFIFIFNLPHIIASFFSFFDKEYVGYYKKHLFFYLPSLLIATVLLLYVNYELGLAFFLVNDIWHGIKQNTGISLILGARPGWVHSIWVFLLFATTAIVYVYLIVPSVFPLAIVPIISPLIFLGIVLLFFVMLYKIWTSIPSVRFYILLATLLIFTSYFFVLSGYIFFSILAFRFVHDVSAFAFYINHDYNRNKDDKKNWLYQILSPVPLPVIILTPLLGVLFAYIIRTAANGIEIGYVIVILIGMTHFYLESVMWKRDSLHRKHVKVA